MMQFNIRQVQPRSSVKLLLIAFCVTYVHTNDTSFYEHMPYHAHIHIYTHTHKYTYTYTISASSKKLLTAFISLTISDRKFRLRLLALSTIVTGKRRLHWCAVLCTDRKMTNIISKVALDGRGHHYYQTRIIIALRAHLRVVRGLFVAC